MKTVSQVRPERSRAMGIVGVLWVKANRGIVLQTSCNDGGSQPQYGFKQETAHFEWRRKSFACFFYQPAGFQSRFHILAKNEVIEKSGLTTIWPCVTSCGKFTAKVGSTLDTKRLS